jgi:TorA maturation chaperone TorD
VFYGATTEGGQTAQPFESLYRCDGGALMGESRGEVYRTLKKARLKVHEGLDLPDDHLSFDAAYEAELCDRAAALLGESDRAGALQVLSEQRAFFEEHIASWFDDFRNRASSMVTTRFYQGILKVTAAFFADEPVLMDDLEKCLSWRRYEE